MAVGTFGIDIDESHLHGGEGVLQFTVAGVALVAEPLGFRAPVDVFLRFPDVRTSAAEAEGLEAHRFQRHVSGENHQVGPGNPLAVFLLDRPEQAAGLVEVAVVGPAVDRREALVARVAAAASVGHAVGARGVPRHADEQAAVVAPVRRPPVLRIRHQRAEVRLQRVIVQLPEFLAIVEILAHRIDLFRLLAQDFQIQPIRPPVLVRLHARLRPRPVHARHRALAFSCHVVLHGVNVNV